MDGQCLSDALAQNRIRARYFNFIGGEWVAPRAQAYVPHHSPSTGEVCCEIARSSAQDMIFALGAAHGASQAWRGVSPQDRRAKLRQIAAVLEANTAFLTEVEHEVSGKPKGLCIEVEVAQAIGHFRNASMAFTSPNVDFFRTSHNVCVQFLPMSYALVVASWAISQALFAGECIVLKPEVAASASVLALVDLMSPILRVGSVNVVTGFDHEIEEALELSRPTRCANAPLRPIADPPNAKPAQVFFADVCNELDNFQMRAIESFGLFAQNQGVDAFAPTRAFVHKDIYERFLSRALGHLSQVERNNRAALPSWELHERTLAYVQIARNGGAILRAGGRPIDGSGHAVQATVFEGTNDMRIFQERVRGPILTIAPFEDMEDVVAKVNDTAAPLAAGVWGRDRSTTARFRAACNAPYIWENSYHAYPQHAAFDGFQQPLLAQKPVRCPRILARKLLHAG